ncbi:MAG: cell division FtsA domain-containing protein [Kiritimatiellae bacterium]|nr:cell division FtsA domain-containing protein [Kiritimatiellia bacterium]
MAKQKQIIAIDTGAHTLRALWLQIRANKPYVTRVESFALPTEEENPNDMIRQWVGKHSLAKAFCNVALDGTQTVFQGGKILHNDPRTARQVAEMDIAQFNEMAGDLMAYDVADFEFDFEPGMRRYIMSMARPAAIEKALRETTQMNLRAADLISAPVALFNALESFAGEHEEPWCYVNIGHHQSDVAIGNKTGLLFARTIGVGGKIFTDAISHETGLPVTQAEVRKQSDCGLRESDACYIPLRAAADRWVSQFNACLGVFRSQYPERQFQVPQLVISGGGTRLKGLKEYLLTKLSMRIMEAKELPNIPPSYQKYVGQFDIAYGLALCSLDIAIIKLSLLPDDLKDEVVFRAKKPWWGAAAIFMFIGMGVYSATGVFLLQRDGALLSAERTRLRTREQIDQHIAQLKLMESQVLTNSLPLARLLMNGPIARDIFSLVCASIDPDDWVTLFCDEKIYNPEEQDKPDANLPVSDAARNPFSLFRAMRPTSAAPAPTGKKEEPLAKKELVEQLDRLFIVEGYTPNPSLKTVRDMIDRLRTSPEITRVDLRSDDQVLAPVGIPELEAAQIPDFRRFVIEIEVNRP